MKETAEHNTIVDLIRNDLSIAGITFMSSAESESESESEYNELIDKGYVSFG